MEFNSNYMYTSLDNDERNRREEREKKKIVW